MSCLKTGINGIGFYFNFSSDFIGFDRFRFDFKQNQEKKMKNKIMEENKTRNSYKQNCSLFLYKIFIMDSNLFSYLKS